MRALFKKLEFCTQVEEVKCILNKYFCVEKFFSRPTPWRVLRDTATGCRSFFFFSVFFPVSFFKNRVKGQCFLSPIDCYGPVRCKWRKALKDEPDCLARDQNIYKKMHFMCGIYHSKEWSYMFTSQYLFEENTIIYLRVYQAYTLHICRYVCVSIHVHTGQVGIE